MKSLRDPLKWTIHVELVGKTVSEVNQTLSANVSSKAFGQPLPIETTAAGMLQEHPCRLETKKREIQKLQNEKLMPKVAND